MEGGGNNGRYQRGAKRRANRVEKAVRDVSLYLDLMLVHAGLKFEGSVAMCVCGPVGVLSCVSELYCLAVQ